MATKANWNYPTAVRFGAGRIAELPDALKATGIKKPLLVTDAGLVNLPVTQNTREAAQGRGLRGRRVRRREAQPDLGQRQCRRRGAAQGRP